MESWTRPSRTVDFSLRNSTAEALSVWGISTFWIGGEISFLGRQLLARCDAPRGVSLTRCNLAFFIAKSKEKGQPKRHMQAKHHERSAIGAFVALNKPPSRYERPAKLQHRPERKGVEGLGESGAGSDSPAGAGST